MYLLWAHLYCTYLDNFNIWVFLLLWAGGKSTVNAKQSPVEHIPSKIEVDVSKLDIEDKVLMQEVSFHPSLKLLSKNGTFPVCKIAATSPVKEPEAVQA